MGINDYWLQSRSSYSLPWTILATLSFALLSLFGIMHHEIWMDEAHSFTLCRDSTSFFQLIQNTRQEGHPLLWYILLWVITRWTHAVISMQLLHLCISCLTIFLLFRYAPFNRLKQLLFSFSYFFFYEYNLISRNYALCGLFITIYCLLICQLKRNYLWIAWSLFLLGNSHFIGLIVSIPLAMVALLYMHKDNPSSKLWPIVILSIGVVIGILQVLPQEDSIFSQLPKPGYLSPERFRIISVPFKSLFHFPDLSQTYTWNTNLFTAYKILGLMLSLAFIPLLIKSFAGKPLSTIIIIGSVISICAFFYLQLMYNYTVRHWGILFLCYYAAVWLSEGLNQENFKPGWYHRLPLFFSEENKKIAGILLYTALLIQDAAALHAYVLDIRQPFCNTQATVQYLKDNQLDQYPIIMSSFMSGAGISAYLDQKIYYPEYKDWGSYGKWNVLSWEMNKKDLIHELHQFNAPEGKAILVLSDPILHNKKKIPKTGQCLYKDSTLRLIYLKSFKESIIQHDQFEVYRVEYRSKR